MILRIAEEFTKEPGPRFRVEGEFSAEEFREELLLPRFLEAEEAEKTLLVDLDGAFGYATSFLEETFGGLARKFSSPERVLKVLWFKTEDEPYLGEDIKIYIQEATGTKVS